MENNDEYPKDWIDKLTYSIIDDYMEVDAVINYFLYGQEYFEEKDPDGNS